MAIGYSITYAWDALRTYKLRAALTLAAMVVGVAFLLIIDAYGQATQVAMGGLFSSATLVSIEYAAPSSGGVFSATGQSTLTPQDLQSVQRLQHVVATSPMIDGRFQLVAGSNSWSSMVWSGGPALESLQSLSVGSGRFFTQQEDTSGAQVAVLSISAARNLFPGVDPVGQRVRIASLDYQVVGVLKPQGMSPAGHDMDEIVYVPVGGSQQRLFGQPFQSILLQVDAPDNVQPAIAAITQVLTQNHRLAAGQPADFNVRGFQETIDAATRAVGTISRVMDVIAGVALLIGGVGIANVMLAAVAQRTREIGVRMAVGARQRDVLVQFLTEAATLSVLGGALGVGLGFGLWTLLMRLIPLLAGFGVWPSAGGAALALGGAVVIGVAFGFYPARRAARLDPVEALRRV